MFDVEHEDKRYHVSFEHSAGEQQFIHHGRVRLTDRTMCYIKIYPLDAPREQLPEDVFTSMVRRHVNDPPNRKVARKFALDKVLRPKSPTVRGGWLDRFDKTLRTKIWRAYWIAGRRRFELEATA